MSDHASCDLRFTNICSQCQHRHHRMKHSPYEEIKYNKEGPLRRHPHHPPSSRAGDSTGVVVSHTSFAGAVLIICHQGKKHTTNIIIYYFLRETVIRFIIIYHSSSCKTVGKISVVPVALVVFAIYLTLLTM